MAVEEINKPVLIEGRLPESENECVVEENFLTGTQKQIGDTIELEIENTTNDQGEEVQYLKQKELTIVGTVRSPLYISSDRGTSSLGAGKINYYVYISKDNINSQDIYTNIYIKVKDAEKYKTSKDAYEDKIEEVKNNIEQIKEERENARYESLVGTATKKVEDAEKELSDQKAEAEAQIQEAENEITNGENELNSAKAEVEQNEAKADKEFQSAEKQIKQARSTLQTQEKELEQKEQEANAGFTEAESQIATLQTNLALVNNGISEVNTNYQQILESLADPNITEEEKAILEQTKQALEQKSQELQTSKSTLEAAIAQVQNSIQQGKAQIESAKQQLQQAKNQLSSQESQLNKQKQSTYNQLASAKQQIADSEVELESGKAELEQKRAEFNEKIQEAEGKIIDAKQEISEIENPTWYVLDRYSNAGYSSFIQDTQSIANIGQVFPIVFFIVAVLISLTSMTRMVEEQRTQIGTLKALGYNKLQIASKYIIYASLACIIGSVLGMAVGFPLLPKIIWEMYSIMYDIEEIKISFNALYGIGGFLLISLCIIGATLYAVLRELNNMPATLMRPKAPKKGKRVILEKIPFIWKRLSFSRKVTVRNIFRYKKRFLMTIIGILGCTALMLTGFGIKDSITAIMPNQFEKVFEYDMQVTLKSELTDEQLQTCKQNLEGKDEVEKVIETYMTSGTAKNNDNEEDVQIVIPKNESDLEGIINLNDLETGERTNLKENEICITDKLAQLLGVKAGDTITIKDSDNQEKQIKISNVVENYIMHYVYMSKSTYENLYGNSYKTNVLLTKNQDMTEEQEETLAADIINQNEVASISRMSIMMNTYDETLKSMNYVVVILIVSAGLLAFVVLYNLSNVNISERIRELATIKVLGFYDKEVYDYVARETTILTIIGIALGLIGGYFLCHFIMGTCEINMLRFSKAIKPISYVYSALLTILFTIIVNIVTYFALKKIDMIESLKSVE